MTILKRLALNLLCQDTNDDEPFTEKMARLTAQLEEQFTQSAKLEVAIRENLRGLVL